MDGTRSRAYVMSGELPPRRVALEVSRWLLGAYW
jgi:hypothetical protein